MSREATLILIGIVVALLAFFSGLPFTYLRWVIAALGAAVAVIAYTQQRSRVHALARESAPLA
ncbi:MAG TPA: hypothetical protein VF439_02320 [Candidatus Paceibacterota bacterium]